MSYIYDWIRRFVCATCFLNSFHGGKADRMTDSTCDHICNICWITVWKVVHTVLTAISQSNGNGQTLTTHRIQTPLTDYDKTLHNWLRPWYEHVTQKLCQTAVRERPTKYIKYNASLFYFYFFPELAYWSKPCMEFHARCLLCACAVKIGPKLTVGPPGTELRRLWGLLTYWRLIS